MEHAEYYAISSLAASQTKQERPKGANRAQSRTPVGGFQGADAVERAPSGRASATETDAVHHMPTAATSAVPATPYFEQHSFSPTQCRTLGTARQI